MSGRRGGGAAGKKRKQKLVISFDAKARAEYLTGFHKRKNERRKQALEQIAKRERDADLERRRMEAKDSGVLVERPRLEAEQLDRALFGETEASEHTFDSKFTARALGAARVTVRTAASAAGGGLDKERQLEAELARLKALVPRDPSKQDSNAPKLKVPTLEQVAQKKRAQKRDKRRREAMEALNPSGKRGRPGKAKGRGACAAECD